MKPFLKATLLGALALAGPARGQSADFGLERLRLDPSALGSLVLPGGEVEPARSVRFGLALHYERDPLVAAEDGLVHGYGLLSPHEKYFRVLQDRLTAHVDAAVGLGMGFELDAELPVVAYQGDAAGIDAAGIAAPWIGLRYGLPRFSPLDVALSLAFQPGWGDRLDLGGNASAAWVPGAGVTWRRGRHALLGSLGAQIGSARSVLGSQELRSELLAGLGWSMEAGPLRYEVTGRGSFELAGAGESVELLGGVRYRLGSAELFAVAGPGFRDLPGTPTFRALLGAAFSAGFARSTASPAPAAPASQGPRRAEQTPPPEAAPAPERAPEPAREPTPEPTPTPEQAQPQEQAHEQPQPPTPPTPEPVRERAVEPPPSTAREPAREEMPTVQAPAARRAPATRETVPVRELQIRKTVAFEFDSAAISPRSLPLLEEVALLLRGSEGIARVVIDGHTDDSGPAELNRALSQRRADAVKAWLVGRGVEEARLEARGVGPDEPAYPNATAWGRVANRRVVFTIQAVAAPTGAPSR